MPTNGKIDLSKFVFESLPLKLLAGVEVDVFQSVHPTRRTYSGMGIDPGRNFGIAAMIGRYAVVYVGQMPKEEEQWLYGIAAYDIMSQSTSLLQVDKVVVEGGFDGVPGAVNLAYTRMGFALGAYYMNKEVEIAPPATIRKAVLGVGTKKGEQVFPGLPSHGADALVCAMYAAGIRNKNLMNGSFAAGPVTQHVVQKSKLRLI